MKLRYKLKLEGFLVRLSHSWPPRILLYNGLSTFFFFYYNIIYLIFLLTKQNPGTTDQRCKRRSSALGGFYWNCMSTLGWERVQSSLLRGQAQSSMYSHRSFSQPSCTCCNKTLRRLSQYLQGQGTPWKRNVRNPGAPSYPNLWHTSLPKQVIPRGGSLYLQPINGAN